MSSTQQADFVARLEAVFGVGRSEGQGVDTDGLRYVLYARKSTDDSGKQERSIGDQIHECKRLAEREGLHIANILHEERSAKLSDNRPIFRSMLEDIQKGTYDAILVWAPDRLARNMKEGGEIIDLLDRGDIRDIKFANGYYFQSDSQGKMMLGFAFVFAKQYTDQLSQNVLRGMTRITAEGKLYDRAKHGYYKDKNGYARPDGENWELIKRAFEMRLSRDPKYSLREIATWLREQGYPKKTKHTERKQIILDDKFLSDLLRDPFYAGAMIRGQQVVDLMEKYDFQAIITPEQFDLLAKEDGVNKKFTLAAVIKPKGSVKADLLRGMVTCAGCNRARSTGTSRKKTKDGVTEYFYFRCDTPTCKYKNKSIRAKYILEAVYDFLAKHPMNFEKGYAAYKREMARLQAKRDEELTSLLKSLHQQRKAAKDRAEEAKQLLAEHKGDAILVKEFKADLVKHLENHKIIEKKIAMTEQEKEAGKTAIQSYEEFIELFGNVAQRIQKITNMADLDFILKKLFSNFVVEGEKVTKITQNSPFGELCGSPDSVMVARRGIEPLLTA